MAFLLAALATLARTGPPTSFEERGPGTAFVVAGLLGGIALLLRPDFAPAVLLGAAPLLARRIRGRLPLSPPIRFLCGLTIACLPLIAWAAIVGPDRIALLVEDLVASRPGRRLPLPGLGSDEGRLLAASLGVACVAIVGGVLRWRAERADWRARVMLALGLALVCLLPSALQRADETHILPAASVAVGVAPLAAAGLFGHISRRSRRRGIATALVAVAAMGAGIAFGTRAELALRAQLDTIDYSSPRIAIGDRSFRIYDDRAAASLNELLPRLARESEPGDRLFVGPEDLRRTNYADTFVYFLFPELRPASFYTEVNPGTANADDSGLADELRAADAILLTTRWDRFLLEPNESRELGSNEPNQVLEASFCAEASAGTYTLYLRC